MVFPIVILWKVRVSRTKKILLSGVFSLVLFTIAATMVRGSIFGGVYQYLDEGESAIINVTWVWFFLYIEFSICEYCPFV